MKNTVLRYLNQSNSTYTVPLSEMCEEDEPADNPLVTEFISYDRMMELVERLPEGYSKVFKLAVLEGLSHKEIGDLLNIAPHSSSSQLHRAKALLKKMIVNYRLILILLLLFFIPLFNFHESLEKTKLSVEIGNTPNKSREKAGDQTDRFLGTACSPQR